MDDLLAIELGALITTVFCKMKMTIKEAFSKAIEAHKSGDLQQSDL